MRLRVMHDVAVGENQAVGSKHKSRASAAPFARLARARAAGSLMHFDVHDGRADAVQRARDCAGVSIEQRIVGTPVTGGRMCASSRRMLARPD